jgi:hypothetical protein
MISNFEIRSYVVVKKVINENTTKFSWLTIDLLNNDRKKATKQMQWPPLDINFEKTRGTLVSDPTSEDIIETTSSLEGSQSLPEGRPLHLAGSSLTISSNYSPEIVPARNIGGRPKGAANAAKEIRIKRKLKALNEAAVHIYQARKHGTLKKC